MQTGGPVSGELPLVFGVRHAGNRALRTALGLRTHKHPDHPDLPSQLRRHNHLVIPLRNPMSIVLSWYRRPLSKHPKFVLDEFKALHDAVAKHQVTWCPMDLVTEREPIIQAVADQHGLTVQEIGPPPVRPVHVPCEVLFKLLEYVQPVYAMPGVRDYYPDPGKPTIEEIYDELANEKRHVDTLGVHRGVWDADSGKRKR